MENTDEEKVPRVFISYSHDNPNHKKWVAELSSELVENGVDVIIDQWDLGFGDDVPKFMENSVAQADRVLMICTETYVRKADEGKGGVGYEAMIVTGELIRNIGTSKFIPIIRQHTDEPILPKAMSTRFYVNLSDGQDHKEQFEELLRELHQIPAVVKPALGKNPFAKQPSGVETPPSQNLGSHFPTLESKRDIKEIYGIALGVARNGDMVAWRKIIRQAMVPVQDGLLEWRQKYERNPPREQDAKYSAALDGLSVFAAPICIALTGVESGRDKFTNQISLLDEILSPRGWNWAGLNLIVGFPKTIAFVYQALHGAICLQTNQLPLAIRLARSKVTLPMESNSSSLYLFHDIIGWPESLGRNSQNAWNFFQVLTEKWEWLKELFGTSNEFIESLCAYYMVLNILEFADTLSTGKEKVLLEQEIRLDIPLCFLKEGTDTKRRAYRLILNEPKDVKFIWKGVGVKDESVIKYWPHWINHLKYWLSRMRDFGLRGEVTHENLLQDLNITGRIIG